MRLCGLSVMVCCFVCLCLILIILRILMMCMGIRLVMRCCVVLCVSVLR